jgi:hypothetical protein
VFERVGLAGAFHPSVALAIAADIWPGRTLEVTDAEFVRIAVLDDDEEKDLHIVLTPEPGGQGFRWETATIEPLSSQESVSVTKDAPAQTGKGLEVGVVRFELHG